MATITITKQWANGQVLLEADLDFIKDDIETFLNTTKITDDNIQNAGITASSKLIDGTISTAKLANLAVTAGKLAADAVTTAKVLDANVTAAKLAADVFTTLIPIASVWPYAAASAPSASWLLCDGSAISRTTYSALFALVSTTYGVGNGTTTFNIPDIRGRVIAGQDDMGGSSANRLTNPGTTTGGLDGDVLGGTGGSETHTLTLAQSPAHDHGGLTGIPLDVGGGGVFNLLQNVKIDIGANVYSPTASAGVIDHKHAITSAGSGTAHNVVQPTIILNYIIRVL